MATQPTVSIIVAVYNAEKTLIRCLKTLLTQTYPYLEIILIDDGSTDGSAAICESYASLDKRIKTYRHENRGVAYTRQRGLDLATGTYVIHADPDDWVASDSLRVMVEYAEEQHSDMLICDFWHNCSDSEVVISQKPTELEPQSVILDFFPRLHGSCCNKLVRRDIILKYELRFDETLSFCEDLIFNIKLLNNPINVSYLNIAHYHYEYDENGDSLASSYNPEITTKDLHLMEVMKKTVLPEMHEQVLPRFAVTLLRRAYEGHIHTSGEFRQLFKPYFQYLKSNTLPIEEHLLMMMSKHGMYRFAYYLSHSWLKHVYFGLFNILRRLNT